MADYTKPSQTEFDSAEQSVLDVLETSAPSLITKAGSVVRELIVRPFALIHAWFKSAFSRQLTESTASYLSSSTKTDNADADLLASNYFVSRRAGTRSKATIAVTTSSSYIEIQANSPFSVDSTTLVTEHRIIATLSGAFELKNNIQYVPSMQVDSSTYIVLIPVVTRDIGDIEILPGKEVTVGFVNSRILGAELVSAVTGGSDTETDSELMSRARYNTAESGIGSYYGLSKKLAPAPVTVLDIGLVAGEDKPLYIARHNSVNINAGGFVDCYVKTQNQASVNTLPVIAEKTGSESGIVKYKISLAGQGFSGIYRITGISVDNVAVDKWDIDVSGIETAEMALVDMLGPNPVTSVTFGLTEDKGDSITANITFSYMPGISVLQQFMDNDQNRFIGQSVRIRAAVPVNVTLDCVAKASPEITDEEEDLLKTTIYKTVSKYRIGTGVLNFSDIRAACYLAAPRIDLRLPCTLSAKVVLKDGSVDSFYSTSGTLDIRNPVNYMQFDPAVCFFSLVPENVTFDKV